MSTTQLRDANGETAPERFLIAHDDYHARHVGRTAEGQQFFVTTPFVTTSSPDGGSAYAARYLFDDDGILLDATIIPIGEAPEDDSAAAPGRSSVVGALLDAVGPVTFADITIAPFSLLHHAVRFGMILNGPDEDDDEDDEWYWNVTIEPGDDMAFYSPWDSGEYDT